MEPSFHAVFGVDLSEVRHSKSWAWFASRTEYLLHYTDTPFASFFRPRPEE